MLSAIHCTHGSALRGCRVPVPSSRGAFPRQPDGHCVEPSPSVAEANLSGKGHPYLVDLPHQSNRLSYRGRQLGLLDEFTVTVPAELQIPGQDQVRQILPMASQLATIECAWVASVAIPLDDRQIDADVFGLDVPGGGAVAPSVLTTESGAPQSTRRGSFTASTPVSIASNRTFSAVRCVCSVALPGPRLLCSA